MMSVESLHGAAPAYALGTLEGRDRLEFEAHLASGCAECTETVEAFRPLALALAQDAPPRAIAPEVRNLLMDLAQAPSLPIDLSALAWEERRSRNQTLDRPPRPGSRHVRGPYSGPSRAASILLIDTGVTRAFSSCRATVVTTRPLISRETSRASAPAPPTAVEFLPGEDCIGYVVSYGGHEPVD
jgi:hypothetical protein